MEQKCKQCGGPFDLSDAEKEFYENKGLSLPKRCKDCRAKNKASKAQENRGGDY
jgi:hypothetical protein